MCLCLFRKMLKHCSPTSVDVRRRSRRNLLTIVDSSRTVPDVGQDMIVTDHVLVRPDNEEFNDEDIEFDTTSVRSYSTSTSCSSTTSPASNKSRTKVVVSLKNDNEIPPRGKMILPSFSVSRTLINSTEPVCFPKFSPALPKSSFKPDKLPSSSPQAKIPIKVYSRCLCADIEYKTLSISHQTTSKDVIWMLLSKFKMRHRDPKLFYLTMDINIKRTGIPLRRTLSLEDDSRPAELKSCHPWGECRFTLQMRKGGLVRIHASVLMPESKYKCLLISETTTVSEVINILFHCYGLEKSGINPDQYNLYEQCLQQGYERKLQPEDQPVLVQTLWPSPSQYSFVLRENQSFIPLFDQSMLDSNNEGFVDDSPCFERATKYRFSDIKEEELADIIVDEVVTSVDDDEDDYHHCPQQPESPKKTHDVSIYSSEGESLSSEYSALRFRDSPMSASSR